MAYDSNRAAFVKQDYRYATVSDESIKNAFPKCRIIKIDSQLSEQAARALAGKILAGNARPRTLEVEIEGIITMSAFIGGCPRYIPDFEKQATDGSIWKVVSATADYQTGITLLRLRR